MPEKKTEKIGLVIVLAIIAISLIGTSKKLYAADTDSSTATNIRQNTMAKDPAKAAVKEDQDKIDQEREAILADDRKLQEARKTGDKVLAEQVKQEITQDITKRKATIRSLKDDIQVKEGSAPAVVSKKRSKGKR